MEEEKVEWERLAGTSAGAVNLDLKVVAEGVETLEQLHFLQQRQCNNAQGYYFSRPITAEEMSMVMKDQFISKVQ